MTDHTLSPQALAFARQYEAATPERQGLVRALLALEDELDALLALGDERAALLAAWLHRGLNGEEDG